MKQRLPILPMLFAAATISVVGCSAGGSSPSPGPTPAPTPTPTPPPVTSPTLQVVPATFDFGKVTTSNRPAPLEVTIRNSGNAALNVSAISFLAPADPSFMLNTSVGTKPCATVSPTLAAGDSCTVQVAFQPPATTGSFASTLQIRSNDPTSPNFGLPIQGASEAIAALTVKINQIDTLACPTSNQLTTAYVSVNDQGGYPVLGLQSGAFSVSQGLGLLNSPLPIISASFIGSSVYKNVAISAVLDHSKSLRDQPVAFADMKSGFSNLFGSLKANDIGEVVKFATEFQVVQPFTADRNLLQAAIAAPFDKGDGTRLYDTVYQAVEDTSNQSNYRRAVIVATDGVEDLPPSAPPSVQNINTVIANAKSKNVPIFTIGIGAGINATDLGRMAAETGGLYYQANTSQNLATIYQQLASLLYENQYVLTFNRTITGAISVQSPIIVTASRTGSSPGTASRDVAACP